MESSVTLHPFAWPLVLIGLSSIGLAYCSHTQAEYAKKLAAAELAYVEAIESERQGHIQVAFQRFNHLCEGSFGIRRSDIPEGACEHSVQLMKNIEQAYKVTKIALEHYRLEHGAYPATLDVIEHDIPKESLAAFQGFEYIHSNEKAVEIVTGLYGFATFSLNR